MTGVEVGIASVVAIVLLIYTGLYIPVALGLVSFVGVWIIRGNIDVPINLLSLAIADTVADHVFATVPLFALMGLIASKCGLGKDIYEVANFWFYKVRGGLGIATVAANAIFASITGSSIASASVFTKVSVPEMKKFNYHPRFTVGVVAGSSVLGMLIPPSAMLIIYAIVAEQSVGQMFVAGIVPGIILSIAYCILIVLMTIFTPKFVGGHGIAPMPQAAGAQASEPSATPNMEDADWANLSVRDVLDKMWPVALLVFLVLGGIYGGVVTPVEAGALGSLAALFVGLIKRTLTWRGLWEVLVETGHITSAILFLIIAASMYSRMLGVAALPTLFGEWLESLDMSLMAIMALYVVLLLLLGTILDTASIILIVVPLFDIALSGFNIDLVWFGIVTVIGAEIGLLTPPLGISCFVIKSTLNDPDVTLFDIFSGAFPFAVTMLIVLIIIIAFPSLSIGLLEFGFL